MPHGEKGKHGATKSMASRKVAGKKMRKGTRRVQAKSNAAVNAFLEGNGNKLAEVTKVQGGNRFEVKFADGVMGTAVIMKGLKLSKGQARANIVSAIHVGDFVIIDTTGGVGHDAATEIKGKITDRGDLRNAKKHAGWPGEASNNMFETPESAEGSPSARSANNSARNNSTRKKGANSNANK
jgi:translation initiation factor IF-1